MSMLKLFEAARRVSVPFLAIRTADQVATIDAIRKAFQTVPTDKKTPPADEYPMLQWDAARGMTAANKLGETALATAKIKPSDTFRFDSAMISAIALPETAILFVVNASRQLQSQEPRDVAANVQALANLREPFKRSFRTVVLLGPDFKAPTEMEQDVVVLDDPLPGPAELKTIVAELHDGIELDDKRKPKPLADAVVAHAVDAVSGLSSFAAEQVVAMSFKDDGGLDLDSLWERKRTAIEQTAGLSVYRGKETFEDLRGLASVKARLRQHVTGKTPIGCVVWIDEGADVFSNVESDTSGVKTDQQRALLVEMEQNDWRGIIAVGVPGSGKSAIARAFGNEAGVPTIAVDFGDMESKFVGDSEQNLRRALDVVKAVGRGNAFFVLTCNSLRGIRPQFQRRFRRGVFFFDLPTAEEREAIWQLYERRYAIKKQPRPNDDGWTGAEIRECCAAAWDTSTTLAEAAKFIIPVARSRATEIEEMRREAHGRFLNASADGAYAYEPEPMVRNVRAILLPKPGTETVQ